MGAWGKLMGKNNGRANLSLAAHARPQKAVERRDLAVSAPPAPGGPGAEHAQE